MSLPRPGTLPSRGISSAPDSPTASWPRGGRGPECGNRARGHPAVPAPPVLMLAPSLLGARPGECRAGLTRLQASGDPFWSLLPQSKAWAGGGTAAPHAHSRTGGMSRRGKVLVHAEASGRPGGRTSARWPFREGPLAGRDGRRTGRTPPPPLHYCVLPSPAHLARLLLPSKALAAAPGTAPSVPQSPDGPSPRGDAARTPTSPAAGAGDPTVGEALTPLPGTEQVTDLRTGVREASRGDSPRLTFETRVLRGGGRIVGEPQAGATVCPERRRWGFTPAWSAYAHQAAGLG